MFFFTFTTGGHCCSRSSRTVEWNEKFAAQLHHGYTSSPRHSRSSMRTPSLAVAEDTPTTNQPTFSAASPSSPAPIRASSKQVNATALALFASF